MQLYSSLIGVLLLGSLSLGAEQDGGFVVFPKKIDKPHARQRGRHPNMPYISERQFDKSFDSGQLKVDNTRGIERDMERKGQVVDTTNISPEGRHTHFTYTDKDATRRSQKQEIFMETSGDLARDMDLSRDQIMFGLQDTQIKGKNGQRAVQSCESDFQTSRCSDEFYRRPDGSCNNINNPNWGKSNTCFIRLLPPNYDGNGITEPRGGRAGNFLPSPRILSNEIHFTESNRFNSITHMVMAFGQFLDHDLTLAAASRTPNNQPLNCCPNSNHPDCFPVIIPAFDPNLCPNCQRETCHNLVRSAVCSECRLGYREQQNQLTHFIDASQVYGSTEQEMSGLRSFRGGRLQASFTDGFELLPLSNDPNNDQCSIPSQRQTCFRAGDTRVNVQPILTSLHTIFQRHHNRIADRLTKMNPSWGDNTVFEETRRIVAAQMQVVVYKEFLPAVLGKEYMNFYDLWILNSGNTRYNSQIDPRIANEFATAAFRFGHSLIQDEFLQVARDDSWKTSPIRNFQFFPFTLFQGELDSYLRGSIKQPAMDFDPHIVDGVRNFLYRSPANRTGMDLAAINIQRGRDHGIPGYVNYVKFCFDDNIRSWGDLERYMTNEHRNFLQRNYRNLEDIDLFSGAMSEKSLSGGVVGPTFGCIIAQQFRNLKFGDRHYFEHSGLNPSFPTGQLNSIRKTTLAKIICANGDTIPFIERNVFVPSSNNNPVVSCNNLPDIDFSLWQG